MAGRLAETLVLTKRIERFQILHATLLLIGGVRRIRPEYCQQAITSFPLHAFYTDTLGLSLNLSQAALQDIVYELYPLDTLGFGMAFNASIIETLNIYSHDDVVSFSFGGLVASFIDSIKEHTAQIETVGISLQFGVSDTQLIDNVIQLNTEEIIAIGLGNLSAVLEDI